MYHSKAKQTQPQQTFHWPVRLQHSTHLMEEAESTEKQATYTLFNVTNNVNPDNDDIV